MKKMLSVLFLIILSSTGLAFPESSWEEKIYSLLGQDNEKEALEQLEAWKLEKGEDDPQYWVTGGNIWYQIAVTPLLEITNLPEGKYEIQGMKDKEIIIADPNSGKAVGKITDGKPRVDIEDMKKAIAFLDEGIKRFPYRLDIFTGRAHLYRTLGDLDGELAALESLIKDPKAGDGEYEIGPGKKLIGELETYQLNMVMNYAREHVQKQNKTDDTAAKEIARLIIKTFPKKPHGYNLLGALASFEGNWPEVKKWLLLALEQAPDDSLVITNLGHCYENMEDIQSAIVQFQRVIELNNDPGLVENAKNKLAAFEAK